MLLQVLRAINITDTNVMLCVYIRFGVCVCVLECWMQVCLHTKTVRTTRWIIWVFPSFDDVILAPKCESCCCVHKQVRNAHLTHVSWLCHWSSQVTWPPVTSFWRQNRGKAGEEDNGGHVGFFSKIYKFSTCYFHQIEGALSFLALFHQIIRWIFHILVFK